MSVDDMISWSNTRLSRLLKFPPTAQLACPTVVNCVPLAWHVVAVLPVLHGTVQQDENKAGWATWSYHLQPNKTDLTIGRLQRSASAMVRLR